MHGVHEDHAFVDAALPQAVLDLGRDVDEAPARRDIEPELFAKAFHTIHHGDTEAWRKHQKTKQLCSLAKAQRSQRKAIRLLVLNLRINVFLRALRAFAVKCIFYFILTRT